MFIAPLETDSNLFIAPLQLYVMNTRACAIGNPKLGPANLLFLSALKRQNAENLKQIFPAKEYRGLSPNFHIHVSVSILYIPTMGLPFLLEEICGPILQEYINRSQTHECGNWGWGHAIPRKGIYKRNWLCSVFQTSTSLQYYLSLLIILDTLILTL